MVEQSAQPDRVLERASVQPIVDAVNDFKPQIANSWSDVASQCWCADCKENASAFSDLYQKTFGCACKEAGKDLENKGVIPGSRFQINGPDPDAVSVTWGSPDRQRVAPQDVADNKPNSGQNYSPTPGRDFRPDAETNFSPDSGNNFAPDGPRVKLPDIGPMVRRPEQNRGARQSEQQNGNRGDRQSDAPRGYQPGNSTGEIGNVYEFKLANNTGNHKVDASIIVPKGYDPNKPTRMLIYNHGFRTDAHAALSYSELPQQMQAADSQTVLVVPEWQSQPGSNSSARGRSDQPNFYRNMLNEVMQKTPELQGKTMDNVESIGVIAHSAGYNPAIAQLYNNGFGNKISSVTVLDSMYNPSAYDRWISSNLQDLASGRKQFQLIYTGHLASQSLALESRVQQQLKRAGLGTESVYDDHKRGGELVSPETMANYGFVFKRSEFTTRGDGAHGAMTHVYVRQALQSERLRSSMFTKNSR